MNGPGNVPQPIPYQGSKRLLAPDILRCFPMQVQRLVEPFAGSAAISLAMAASKRAARFWINDAHGPLIELWKTMVGEPDELADQYEKLWDDQTGQEREFFNEVRTRFNETHAPADFLYLLARCVKAAIRYNSRGEFNNTPDNRRKGARPAEMRLRIQHAHQLLKARTEFTSDDYRSVLRKCKKKDLVYMDPPYQGVCGNRDQRYMPSIVHAEFCDELEALNKRNIMYAVSYDGRTGNKVFGEPMPESLGLAHLELMAGRSTQATLLGRQDVTYVALYLSPALAELIDVNCSPGEKQLALW